MRPTTCRYCKYQFHIKEDIKLQWKEDLLKCPDCGILYCVLPKTERDLRLLQDKFIATRDEKIVKEIYVILYSYTKSLFLKSFSNITTDTVVIEYYVKNAISYFIEQYYVDNNFKIKSSFGAFLLFKLKQAIFQKSEHLSEFSLDYQLEDGNYSQFEDSKGYFDAAEKECDAYILINHIKKLLIKIGDYSDSPFENYMRELGLSLHLHKGERHADSLYRLYNKEGKLIYIYTLDVLRSELWKTADLV